MLLLGHAGTTPIALRIGTTAAANAAASEIPIVKGTTIGLIETHAPKKPFVRGSGPSPGAASKATNRSDRQNPKKRSHLKPSLIPQCRRLPLS